MILNPPRIAISALRGGAGKTVISLGLSAFWLSKGYNISPFKKGPDFIDAGWMSLAAGRQCHNLDHFMMTDSQILESFIKNSTDSDISVIEGNRGLFDGLDIEGCCSTSELAKLLKSPLILIVDVTMTTRTVAALVLGCQSFDPNLKIAGVILNRVAGPRQEALTKNSIERYCGIPVIGSIPKLKKDPFPERHMGLVPHQERATSDKAIAWARGVVEKYIDTDFLWDLANKTEPIQSIEFPDTLTRIEDKDSEKPRIGYIMDHAFWFYYPENLEKLELLGANLIKINAIEDRKLPSIDALYIGGGFPETQAERISDNEMFRNSLKQGIESGLPVYAECGGLMFMGENLLMENGTFPMVGALPVEFELEKKPQGHGYTILAAKKKNPYYQAGEEVKGHEFHYSRPVIKSTEEINTVFEVKRGHGLDGKNDGILYKNLFATYTHLHAAGYPEWGQNLYKAGQIYMDKKRTKF